MLRQWTVTLRSQPGTTFVTGERVDVTPEWVTFVDHAGEVVLLVPAADLVKVEQWTEPPF